MNVKRIIRLILPVLGALTFTLILLSFLSPDNQTAQVLAATENNYSDEMNILSLTTTFTDGFNSPTLDSRWSWINEDNTHWSLTDRPGYLRITTQEGGLFSGFHTNLLVTNAPFGDYQISSKVIISPTEMFHGAHVVVYGDDDNYIRMGRRFGGSGNEVNFRHVENGSIAVGARITETATSVYLRIIKVGDTYTGFYSLDGNSYVSVGQTSATITNTKVGIISESGPSKTEIESDYDFFELVDGTKYIYLPAVFKEWH